MTNATAVAIAKTQKKSAATLAMFLAGFAGFQ
jgi:hypothetical protein